MQHALFFKTSGNLLTELPAKRIKERTLPEFSTLISEDRPVVEISCRAHLERGMAQDRIQKIFVDRAFVIGHLH